MKISDMNAEVLRGLHFPRASYLVLEPTLFVSSCRSGEDHDEARSAKLPVASHLPPLSKYRSRHPASGNGVGHKCSVGYQKSILEARGQHWTAS